ncbi:MFS transporter [Actinoplanes couchii]|uniref:MFS transporter n=1 Tax=Actinoplanes couchii TaxID=403638 RepID=A0ABQ3XBD5_9ACTN|nr:MFS transporter [Actinoplanes couchii]MDR6323260.1 MFS family permease [Actinoplanes couchii]GID55774.1 MFS transporter [Actinoplanes couchii]
MSEKPTAGLVVPAVAVMVFIAASTAPTPIYPLYQSAWHFPALTLTVIFAVYCVALLAALLTVGSLADHIGRRPVLLAAIGIQILSLAVFALADGVPALIAARILQGLATGTASGALAAAIMDADQRRGPLLNATMPIAGTAAGPLLAALLVQFAPQPMRTTYVLLILALAGLTVAVVTLLPGTETRRPGALASLRPSVHVPAPARRAFLIAAPITVAAWAMGGFYLSLGPAMTRMVTGSAATLTAGLVTFLLPASALAAVLLMRRASGRTLLITGSALMFAGATLTVLAVAATVTTLFFLSAALAGMGFGTGFQGAIRTVLPLAAPGERAGLASALYAVTYLAMGLPAVTAGAFVLTAGLPATAEVYGASVAALALAALLAALAETRSRIRPAVLIP